MKVEELDFVLVPVGLTVMVLYHLWLLHRIIKYPTTTVIGINAINRRNWVRTIMEDPLNNGILAVQTLRNNIMASTLLATMAITLCSSMVVLMTKSDGGGYRVLRWEGFVLGDTGDLALSVKFLAILVCFLLAFLLNVQSIRYYSHAGILITVPARSRRVEPDLAAEYVARALNRGSCFWSLGLRAFYFSIPLFLCIFGPVPTFVSCLVLVFVLYFLDVDSGWGENGEEARGGGRGGA